MPGRNADKDQDLDPAGERGGVICPMTAVLTSLALFVAIVTAPSG